MHDWRSLISCVQFDEREALSSSPEAVCLVVSTVGDVLLDGGLSAGEISGFVVGGVHRYFVMNSTSFSYEEWWNDLILKKTIEINFNSRSPNGRR